MLLLSLVASHSCTFFSLFSNAQFYQVFDATCGAIFCILYYRIPISISFSCVLLHHCCIVFLQYKSATQRCIIIVHQPGPILSLFNWASLICRYAFSTITIPSSTTTPMASAMPVNDMMLDEMPNACNRIKPIDTEMGN